MRFFASTRESDKVVRKRLKLGLLTNELFSQDLGRMGGFGWAVQQVPDYGDGKTQPDLGA